jgi:hypothetical protein
LNFKRIISADLILFDTGFHICLGAHQALLCEPRRGSSTFISLIIHSGFTTTEVLCRKQKKQVQGPGEGGHDENFFSWSAVELEHTDPLSTPPKKLKIRLKTPKGNESVIPFRPASTPTIEKMGDRAKRSAERVIAVAKRALELIRPQRHLASSMDLKWLR